VARSITRYITYIRTTPETLWHALTTPEVIEQYWFGNTAEGDWTVGSEWRLCASGQVLDAGRVIENVPRKRLVRSWRNEWRPEFKAEGESECVYELEPAGTAVKLTVTHSMSRAHSTFIDVVAEAWPMCMSNLKSFLETGVVAVTDHPGHD